LENPAKPVKYQGVVNSIKEQARKIRIHWKVQSLTSLLYDFFSIVYGFKQTQDLKRPNCNNLNCFSFRSDVVREIFFHFTEVREGDNVDLGDDVEFTIQVFYLNT
jgi:hypothetical protein